MFEEQLQRDTEESVSNCRTVGICFIKAPVILIYTCVLHMLDIGNELIGTKMEEITVESLTNRVYHSLQLKYAITIRPCMVNALVLPLRAYFTAEDNFWFSVDVILGYVRYLFSFLKPVGKFERPRVQSLGPDRLRSVSYPVLRTFCPLY